MWPVVRFGLNFFALMVMLGMLSMCALGIIDAAS